MPVINFDYNDLCGLIGKEIPKDVLVKRIPLIGADMHDTDDGDEDAMSVEFFPDRPDLFSVEGLARSMRAFLDLEPGMKSYQVENTKIEVVCDKSVESVRPHIMCAAVFDIDVTDDVLKSIMEMQEKLHLTIGRKRSKIAIGIHDLDMVKPPFVYKAVEPKKMSFVPLTKTEKWNLDEILEKHEKGKEYAHLLKGKKLYPIILDANNDVLSFPPIINGTRTTVTTKTKNLFIDVTGTDPRTVKGSLDLVCTALAERGGRIGAVSMRSLSKLSPDLTPSVWSFSAKECEKFIGVKMDTKDIVSALKRMGMDAVSKGDKVTATVPATRLDIMHTVDLYEDVAIGYGFERFGGVHTLTQTNGNVSDATYVSERVRDIMTGLGYYEVTTLTLSSENEEFVISGLPKTDVVKVRNPITEDHTCLRASLMPSLMKILRRNKHRDLPQRIFEVGDVVREEKKQRRVCALATHSKASFTEIKSTAESVLKEMNIEYTIRPCAYATFIEGRGAEIVSGGKLIGYFGEMSPQVITDFDIDHPIILFEMEISSFIENFQRGLI